MQVPKTEKSCAVLGGLEIVQAVILLGDRATTEEISHRAGYPLKTTQKWLRLLVATGWLTFRPGRPCPTGGSAPRLYAVGRILPWVVRDPYSKVPIGSQN